MYANDALDDGKARVAVEGLALAELTSLAMVGLCVHFVLLKGVCNPNKKIVFVLVLLTLVDGILSDKSNIRY